MADTEATVAPVTQTPEKKSTKKAASPKKDQKIKAKPSHPPTADMVNNAIKGLKERGGSSLQAIKKYIAANYKVDPDKVAPFIKKYLKSAVINGTLVQTKGKGASGSFKLGGQATGAAKKPATKKVAKKPVAEKKTAAKQKTDKKVVTSPKTKKAVAEKKAVKAKKPVEKKVAKAKSPKAKKTTKAGPTKKPKSPKPKTVKVTKSPKKAAAPKKK